MGRRGCFTTGYDIWHFVFGPCDRFWYSRRHGSYEDICVEFWHDSGLGMCTLLYENGSDIN